MRKNKLNKLLKNTMLLCILTTSIIACQKEDDFKYNEPVTKVQLKRISLKDIKQNHAINQSLNKISRYLDVNKTKRVDVNLKINSANNEFTILTDEIVSTTTDSSQTYTFRIETPTHPESSFENFIIDEVNDSIYAFFIYRYKPNTTYSFDNTTIDYVISRTEVDPNVINITDFSDVLNNKIYYDENSGCLIDVEEHVAEDGETYYGIAQVYWCPESSDSGSSSNDNSTTNNNNNTGNNNTNTSSGGQNNNGAGTGSTGGDGSSTVAILPCRGADCPDVFDPVHDENCKKLYDFSTSPYSQDEFSNQESDISLGYEKGYLLRDVAFFPYFFAQPIQASGDCKEMTIPLNNSVFGFMHTHPTGCGEGTYPMFYEGDLHTLYRITQEYNINTPPDISKFVAYMTVQNNHYAIKIDDIDKFNKIGSIYNNAFDKKKFLRKFEQLYKNEDSQQTLEIAFLEFVNQTYNLGVSLYKTSHDDIVYDPNLPLDEQTSNWVKLTLDQNTYNITTIKEVPCN